MQTQSTNNGVKEMATDKKIQITLSGEGAEDVAKALTSLTDLLSVFTKAPIGDVTTPEPKKTSSKKKATPEPETTPVDAPDDFFSELAAMPNNKDGLNFDDVSSRFFSVMEMVTNKMGAKNAANATAKLLNKHTGGQPISEKTLPLKNWLPLMADLDQVEKLVNGG